MPFAKKGSAKRSILQRKGERGEGGQLTITQNGRTKKTSEKNGEGSSRAKNKRKGVVTCQPTTSQMTVRGEEYEGKEQSFPNRRQGQRTKSV